jgi:hypothetical protein
MWNLNNADIKSVSEKDCSQKILYFITNGWIHRMSFKSADFR